MFIQTYSGKKFSFLDPQPEDICIDDIAHHLGKICRFNGATKVFYSVAQHSLLVSDLVPACYRYEGLMHDAGEAYYGDITSPFKAMLQQIAGAHFTAILQKIDIAVAIALHANCPMSKDVKTADLVALATEKRDLMNPCTFSWVDLPEPSWMIIHPIPAEMATVEFLKRYEESR